MYMQLHDREVSERCRSYPSFPQAYSADECLLVNKKVFIQQLCEGYLLSQRVVVLRGPPVYNCYGRGFHSERADPPLHSPFRVQANIMEGPRTQGKTPEDIFKGLYSSEGSNDTSSKTYSGYSSYILLRTCIRFAATVLCKTPFSYKVRYNQCHIYAAHRQQFVVFSHQE